MRIWLSANFQVIAFIFNTLSFLLHVYKSKVDLTGMSGRWLVIVLMMAVGSISSVIGNEEKVFGQAQIAKLTSKDYGGHPIVSMVVESPSGLMYALSQDGVYEISSSGSRRIIEGNYTRGAFDEDQNLWLTGYRSFARCFHNESGVWENEDLYDIISGFDLEGFLVNSILFKDGFVYLGSLKRALRFDPENKTAEVVFETPYIARMYKVGGQLLPVGAEDRLVSFDGEKLLDVPGSQVFYGPNVPAASGQMANGDVVILTRGGDFWKYDGRKVDRIPGLKYVGDPDYQVSWIECTEGGSILVGTLGNGIHSVDASGCQQIQKKNGLLNNIVNSIHQASNGLLWVSHNRGVSVMRYPQTAWSLGEDQGIQGNVMDLCLTEKNAYVLTSVGVYQVGIEKLVKEGVDEFDVSLLPFAHSRTCAVVDEQVIIGTTEGLMLRDDHGWTQLGTGDCSIVLKSEFFEDRVYFGGYEELHFIEKSSDGSWSEPVTILSRTNVVHGLSEDENGALWVRMGMGQLGRLLAPENADRQAWLFQVFAKDAGVPSNWVNPLVIEGRCHIFTGEGLAVYDEASHRFVEQNEWLYFGGEGPFSFTQEVWSRTKGYRVAYSDLIGNLSPKPERDYFEALNFFCEDVDNRAYCMADRENLRIIGFSNGIILQLKGVEQLNVKEPLHLFLSEVRNTFTNREVVSNVASDEVGLKDETFEMSINTRELKFSFTSNQQFLGQDNLYNFYLRGYENEHDNWVPDTSKTYTNLSPGSYTFVLNCLNYKRDPSQTLEFSFEIPTPWYRTKLAYAGYLFTGLLLILGSFRFRERQLRKRNMWLSRVVEARTEEMRLQSQELLRKNDRLEEALSEAEKLSDESKAASIAKGRFLASMSHEIRTPMNGVIGMCSLMEDTKLDDQQRQLLETIRESGDHLLTILNDILDFSKIEAGKLDLQESSFSLRRIAENVVTLMAPLAKEKGIELTLFVDPKLRKNRIGDPARLRQIFLNLLGNAIKFTENGFVRVRINPIESEEQKDWIRIEFEDSGIGIPFEKQDQLFAPFSQVDDSNLRRFGGTGLGLSISKNLTDMMGGDMFVFSLPGKGTIFGLELPLHEDEEHAVEDSLFDFAGHRIWIASKDDARSHILQTYLTDLGAEVDVIQDDRVFLDHIFELSEEKPNLVVIDRVEGFPSATTQQALKENLESVVVLNLENEIRERDPESHQLSIIKPFPYDQFVHLCHNALKSVSNLQFLDHDVDDKRVAMDDLSGLRVLLVEDNLVNQKVAKLMLKKFGLDADVVSNGELAINAITEKHYDLVLMDIQMPVMDGIEATRWVREHIEKPRQPKIVAMTAGVTQLDRDLTEDAEMDGFIEKPVQPASLYRELVKVVFT